MICALKKLLRRLRWAVGLQDKGFFSLLFKISLPIILQQAISAALYMIDNVMIGVLGETELAAVGAANQMTFFMIVCLFGVTGGAGVFLAQYWGKCDLVNMHRVQGLCLMISLGIAVAFLCGAQFLGKAWLRFFSPDDQVVLLGNAYWSIASIGYIMQAITLTFAATLKACSRVRPAMITGSIGLITNTVLNYALIFGHFGFEAMGVRGAAIATLIAAALDMSLLLAWIYAKHTEAAASLKALVSQSRDLTRTFLRVCSPVFFNECLWSLSVVCLSFLYSHMGTGVLAGMIMFNTMERLAFVIFIGIGNACLIMIGNRIGEGKRALALRYARRFITLGLLAGAAVGIILLAAGPYLLTHLNVSADIRGSIGVVIMVFGLTMPAHVSEYILIVGVLRSGGDTRMAMRIDVIGQWLIYVPLAYFMGLGLGLPIEIVYLASLPCELYKTIYGIARMRSGVWVNDVTAATLGKTCTNNVK